MESDVAASVVPPAGERAAKDVHGERARQTRLAVADLREGLAHWPLWKAMAWQDILQRYRGSMLGPFWLTISMAIMIAALGALYSTLFKIKIDDYLPFLCLGILTWSFLSTIVVESCTVFTSSETIIKQIRIAFSVYVFRMVWRNLIILGHNAVVYVVVMLIFGIAPTWATLLALPGLALALINAVWVALLFGLICARFRDVPQIVASLTQVVFFVTPIIWKPELLGPYEAIAHLNPFMSFVDLIRAPLLGQAPDLMSWLVAGAVTVCGWLAAFNAFVRFRGRIPYWC